MGQIFSAFKGVLDRSLRNRVIIIVVGFLGVVVLNKVFQNILITEPYSSGVILLTVGLCLFSIVLLYRFFSKIDLGFWGTFLFSMCYALIVSWILREYRFGFHGIDSDAYFNLALISTYYENWLSSDFTYQGKSSFYPFYFQYVLGKVGLILGESPNMMAKYGVIFTVYFVPIATYSLWNSILKDKMVSFFLTVIVFLSLTYPLYIKPYKIIVLVLIIPWFYYYFIQNTTLSKKKILIGGLLGGLLFGTYYFFFFLFVLYVIISLFNKLFEDRSQFGLRYLKGLFRDYKSHVLLVIVIVIVASPYIIPYVYDILTHPFDSTQNKYFLHGSIKIGLFSFNNILFVAALIFLATDIKNKLSKYLLILLLACLLFLLLGYFGLLLDSPILIEHIYPFLHVIGYTALVLFIERIIRPFSKRFNTITFMILSFIGIFQLGTNLMKISKSNLIELELAQVPPILKNEGIAQELKGSVLLTNTKLNGFVALNKFVEANSFYAHPSSETARRTKFLKGLYEFEDKRFQTLMLQYNQFDKVDYVVYSGLKGLMQMNTSHYPYMPHFKAVFFELKRFTDNNPNLVELPTDDRYYKVFKLDELSVDVFNNLTEAQKRFAYMYGNNKVKSLLQNWRVKLPKEPSEEYLGDFELYNLSLFNTLEKNVAPKMVHKGTNGTVIKLFDSPKDSSKIVVFGVSEYFVYRNAHLYNGRNKTQVSLNLNLFQNDSLIEKKSINWSKEKINSYRSDGIIYQYFEIDKNKGATRVQLIFNSPKLNFRKTLPVKP